MEVTFTLASTSDASALARIRGAAARDLTARCGEGPWSNEPSERGVLGDFRGAEVWIARDGQSILATFRLGSRKPWAIDTSYFTACRRPIYLTNMVVHPDVQRRGIGRLCLVHAEQVARRRRADAIRLDAYDAQAGAGPFYATCGFREVGRTLYRTTALVYYERVLRQVRLRGET